MPRLRRTISLISSALIAGCTGAATAGPTVPTAHVLTAQLDRETLPAVVAFRTALDGFAVETVQRPDESFAARILRTEDAGRNWTLVWQRTSAELSTVTLVGHRIVAAGSTLDSSGDLDAPLLVTSGNDGRSWTAGHPVLPVAAARRAGGSFFSGRLLFMDRRVGFLLPAPQDSPSSSPPLRTDDGGRTWTSFHLGRDEPTALAFVTRTHWVAAATGNPCGRLWATTDSGAKWSPIAGTCEPFPLTSLSFPTPSVGYAAGGYPPDQSLAPDRAVLTTLDGGRTWRLTWARGVPGRSSGNGGGPFVGITFVSAEVGYTLAGVCASGQNAPCLGPLWRTADGGRDWTRTRFDGYQLDPVGDQRLYLLATAQPSLAVSTDNGATFVTRPIPVSIPR